MGPLPRHFGSLGEDLRIFAAVPQRLHRAFDRSGVAALGRRFSAGGILGVLIADSLISSLNLTGAVLLTSICLIVAIYLISTFSMVTTAQRFAGPLSYLRKIFARWNNW